MPKILVVNDDGVQAPGLFALVQALRTFGDVTVSAPAINQSASGHKKTLFQDIPVTQVLLRDDTAAFAVGGSPADCIALMALGVWRDWPPDIVVSGINRGGNMGQDITYSGTISAALEASIQGIPAVAVSLDNPLADKLEDYQNAVEIAVKVVKRTLENRLPPLTILNLNVPNVETVKGVRLARQGLRIYQDELASNEDGSVFRIVGPAPSGRVEHLGTDLWAVHRGYASLTPIHLDLTAHQFLAELSSWDLTL